MKNYKLLIDKDCPLCNVYGQCFLKLNLLPEDGLTPYQTIAINKTNSINMDRAKTEIALHDSSTGLTLYGLQSIITIATQKYPKAKTLLLNPILFQPLNILYKFISYNRKVLYPSPLSTSNLRNCEPAINLKYRWAYIIFVALFTAIVVNNFTFNLFTSLGWAHTFYTELLVCFGQVAWQGIAATILIKNKRLNYLGNMSTVSLIGAILLLPLLMIADYHDLSISILMAYFSCVIFTMFVEHIRRCQLLDITHWMTASWILFRFIALTTILLTLNII